MRLGAPKPLSAQRSVKERLISLVTNSKPHVSYHGYIFLDAFIYASLPWRENRRKLQCKQLLTCSPLFQTSASLGKGGGHSARDKEVDPASTAQRSLLLFKIALPILFDFNLQHPTPFINNFIKLQPLPSHTTARRSLYRDVRQRRSHRLDRRRKSKLNDRRPNTHTCWRQTDSSESIKVSINPFQH